MQRKQNLHIKYNLKEKESESLFTENSEILNSGIICL